MPTTREYIAELTKQKKQLAANLTAKGVTASETETFNTLVPKVSQISDIKDEEVVLENFTNINDTLKTKIELSYPNDEAAVGKTIDVQLASGTITDWSTVNVYSFSKNFLNVEENASWKLRTINTYIPAGEYVISFDTVAQEGEGITEVPVVRFNTNKLSRYLRKGQTLTVCLTQPETIVYLYSNGYSASASQNVTATVTKLMLRPNTEDSDYVVWKGSTNAVATNATVTGIPAAYPKTYVFTNNTAAIFDRVTGGTYKEITPSEGKNAITKVYQPSVTSDIDSNIIAENIKKDVNILGVTGEYICNYTYDETTKELVLIL